MAKLSTIRLTLVILQLISVTVASIIIIIYYNPWIIRIIDEAERSGNTGRSLADQIRRTDNEELVIFLMSTTTIIVSIVGIIGAIRNYEHNNCLLNFYMSTLIIFLFVIFVAFCGTIWQVFGKLNQQSSMMIRDPWTENDTFSATTTVSPFQRANNISSTTIQFIDTITHHNHHQHNNNRSNINNAQILSWWYIIKSLILITFSAILYATSLKLTRKIVESSDDHYLSANEFSNNCNGDGCINGNGHDNDDLNSEDSYYVNNNGIIGHTAIIYPYTTNGNNPLRYQQHNCTTKHHTSSSSKSSLGSQFRTIL